MLRNATKSTTSRSNISFERVLSSSSTAAFSLKSFSTWLDTHHLPQGSSSSAMPVPSALPSSRRYASTRRSPHQTAEAEAQLAQMPRFMRRQMQQKTSSVSPPTCKFRDKRLGDTKPTYDRTSSERPLIQGRETRAPSSKPTVYRSRHYDASNETPKDGLRPLEPHVLSGRLKRLCDAGKVDDAVSMLKNAPLDAQNTPVWNTLIWEALKVNRYQLAYQLYVDMKRRGFSPTSRTYQTFFNGLARIEEWATYPKQLSNARSLYEGFQRHVSSVKRMDPEDEDLTPTPLAGYIRLLGNAGQYQEIFDVYYAMDSDGPLAPNQFIWTALFQAITTAKSDTVEGSVKVAADARLLWSQMTKAAKKNPKLAPDSHTVSAAISALSGGNQIDYDLGFKIIAEYFGLLVNSTISEPGILPLGPEALNTILKFCNRTKQYDVATQFLQQVKRRPKERGGVNILDRLHMEEILKADIAVNGPGLGYHAVDTLEWMLREEITSNSGPKIRPALSTYSLVMQACWRSGDWNAATRTFDLMTGYHAHDFKDGAVAAAPRLDKRGLGRSIPPNAEIMSSMVRAAFTTKNRADMRQALRIVNYLGLDQLARATGTPYSQQETAKSLKHRKLFGKKLASAVLETFDYVMEDNGKYVKPDEAAKWRILVKEAEALESGDDIGAETVKSKAPPPAHRSQKNVDAKSSHSRERRSTRTN